MAGRSGIGFVLLWSQQAGDLVWHVVKPGTAGLVVMAALFLVCGAWQRKAESSTHHRVGSVPETVGASIQVGSSSQSGWSPIGDTELWVPTGGFFASGTRFYSYNGQIIATRTSSGGLTWKLADHHGTTYATVDAANLAVTKRWQDPYGTNRGTPPSTWPDKHGFLGGYQNTTGVTHIGARDYDPLTGRFMTADSVLDTSDPQALNAYSYGNNSPVSFSDPTGMVLQIDGRPAYIGSAAMISMSAAAFDRAYQYNVGVAHNWLSAVTRRTPPTYPSFVGRENHLMSPKERRARWETQFANWSLQAPDHRPPDYDQFAAAFCFEFGDVRACDPSPPSLEETLEVLGLIASIPTGAWLARLGGEFVAGAVAGIEGSIWGGGAVAVGAGAGALGDLGPSLVAAKIAAEAVGGDSAAAAWCRNSFTGDTPVLMADGSSKPISEVKVGDEIRNAEPEDGLLQRHIVSALHVTDDDHDFVDVTVETPAGLQMVVATAHHPFWDLTSHSWTEATEIGVGDQLSAPGEGQITVRAVHRYTSFGRTYNLTVDIVHTYYVLAGNTPILVHNCNPIWTATKDKTPVENAYRHFMDHGGEFGDVQNSLQYVRKARDWFDNPTPTTLSRTRPSGDIVRFDPQTDYFGVMAKDGTPRTFFRPDPAKHGYATNLDYFNAQ